MATVDEQLCQLAAAVKRIEDTLNRLAQVLLESDPPMITLEGDELPPDREEGQPL